MRKIAVSMILALAGMGLVLAQNFKLEANGKTITEGETVVVSGLVDNDEIFSLALYMKLTNTSSEKMTVSILLDTVHKPIGTGVQICGFGLCRDGIFLPDQEMEPGEVRGEDHVFDALDIAYIPKENFDTAVIGCTVNDVTAGKSLRFDIKFIPTDTPVANESNKELAGVSVYPNPGNGLFNLNVPVQAKVDIFSAAGQFVRQMQVQAGTTPMQLENAGIYFVKVSAANGQTAVKRVVVR